MGETSCSGPAPSRRLREPAGWRPAPRPVKMNCRCVGVRFYKVRLSGQWFLGEMRAMGATHKEVGQTFGALRVNCARLSSSHCIAMRGTSVGLSSVILFFFLPLSCVPWLHARYALPRSFSFAHGFLQRAFIASLACSAFDEALPLTGSVGYGADFAQRSQGRPTVWPKSK